MHQQASDASLLSQHQRQPLHHRVFHALEDWSDQWRHNHQVVHQLLLVMARWNRPPWHSQEDRMAQLGTKHARNSSNSSVDEEQPYNCITEHDDELWILEEREDDIPFGDHSQSLQAEETSTWSAEPTSTPITTTTTTTTTTTESWRDDSNTMSVPLNLVATSWNDDSIDKYAFLPWRKDEFEHLGFLMLMLAVVLVLALASHCGLYMQAKRRKASRSKHQRITSPCRQVNPTPAPLLLTPDHDGGSRQGSNSTHGHVTSTHASTKKSHDNKDQDPQQQHLLAARLEQQTALVQRLQHELRSHQQHEQHHQASDHAYAEYLDTLQAQWQAKEDDYETTMTHLKTQVQQLQEHQQRLETSDHAYAEYLDEVQSQIQRREASMEQQLQDQETAWQIQLQAKQQELQQCQELVDQWKAVAQQRRPDELLAGDIIPAGIVTDATAIETKQQDFAKGVERLLAQVEQQQAAHTQALQRLQQELQVQHKGTKELTESDQAHAVQLEEWQAQIQEQEQEHATALARLRSSFQMNHSGSNDEEDEESLPQQHQPPKERQERHLLRNLQTLVKQLEGHVRARQEQCDALQTQSESQHATTQALLDQLQVLQQTHDVACRDYEATVNELQTLMDQHKKRVLELTQELERRQATMLELQAGMTQLQSTVGQYHQDSQEQTQQVEQWTKDLQDRQTQATHLRSDLQHQLSQELLRAKVDSLEHQLHQQQHVQTGMNQHMTDLATQYQKSQTTCDQLLADKKALEKKLQRRKEDLVLAHTALLEQDRRMQQQAMDWSTASEPAQGKVPKHSMRSPDRK